MNMLHVLFFLIIDDSSIEYIGENNKPDVLEALLVHQPAHEDQDSKHANMVSIFTITIFT